MSLYTCLIEKDKAYIAADSRQGAFVGDKYYRIDDDVEKLSTYDGFAYTFGGSAWIADYIKKNMRAIPDEFAWARSLQTVLAICKYACDNATSILKIPNLPKEVGEGESSSYISQAGIEAEICAVGYNKDTNEHEFYSMSSERNFELEKLTLKDVGQKTFCVFGGFNNTQAREAYEKYSPQYKNKQMDILTLFQKIYEDSSDEYVGGTLHLVELIEGKVSNQWRLPIKDKKEIPTININSFFAHNLIGKNLCVMCDSEDGKQRYFKFDMTGAHYHNTGIEITSDDEGSGNGITLGIGEDEGLIITRNNGMFRVVLNANSGMYFQKAKTANNWETADTTMEIQKDGTAVFGGALHAKSLYLQEIGGNNILTYWAKDNKGNYNVVYDNNTEVDSTTGEVAEPKYKLSGNYIEGRGLKAYDSSNNLRVRINGADGSLSMYNGYIEMKDDNDNSLYINPQDFITWCINGVKKFYYDATNNSLVFGGSIDTLEDVKVGEEIMVRDNQGNKGFTISAKSGSTGDSVALSASSGRYIEITTSGLIRLQCSIAYLNNDEIWTKNDIQNWVTANFESKSSTNLII